MYQSEIYFPLSNPREMQKDGWNRDIDDNFCAKQNLTKHVFGIRITIERCFDI